MSVLWPDVSDPEGRQSAIRRGFWGGAVITLISAAAPPPVGALSLIAFGAATIGIHFGSAWAARAGVIAALAPLAAAAQLPDNGLIFGAFFQCFIGAYFFFSAWRGLRAKGGLLGLASAAAWLTLGLSFLGLSYLTFNRFQVPNNPTAPTPLIAGDWVLIERTDHQPLPGDIVLLASTDAATPPVLQRVDIGQVLEPKQVLGVARWRVWSDTTLPTDSPIAYYTKARWSRFPARIR